MRTGMPTVRGGPSWAGAAVPLDVALGAILGRATPLEPVEVSLAEAVGLVLAEPLVADLDLPPFDRAAAPGFAVRAADATAGALLRVASPWSDDGHEVDRGEAAPVEAGDPLPIGADAVIGPEAVRADPADGPARVIEVLDPPGPGRAVVRRGSTLAAGSTLAEAGERLRPASVPLLAAQGCVHPSCHRRVRVAIVAVGDHLVGPADEPVLHHERNATNAALSALILGRGGMVHDLGSVAPADLPGALDRALRAHVALVIGTPLESTRRALDDAGVVPTLAGLALDPGGPDSGHGLARDDDGRSLAHVLLLPLDPLAASTVATLVVLPLIARLQGSEGPPTPPLRVVWDAAQPATSGRHRAVAASLHAGADGRLRARPVVSAGPVDLPDLALADGLALFPPHDGPWHGGEVVPFAPFTPWIGRPAG